MDRRSFFAACAALAINSQIPATTTAVETTVTLAPWEVQEQFSTTDTSTTTTPDPNARYDNWQWDYSLQQWVIV